MSCSLHGSQVQAVLETLHAASEEIDPPLLAKAEGKDGDERTRLLDQAFIPVSPDAGRLLYVLARGVAAGTIVEFGTSFGISTIYLAADFTATASRAGKEFKFSLKAALKQGPVVVYFYPSAFTGGCNIEAHTFADNQEQFAAAGASIIGVSRDSIARLNAFSADPQYCAGKIPVASDPDGAIAAAYHLTTMDSRRGLKDTRGQVIDHDFTERTTFVVMPDATIAATLSTADDKISPAAHVERSLEVVKQIAAGSRAK